MRTCAPSRCPFHARPGACCARSRTPPASARPDPAISDVVGALKPYAYLGQGPVQAVDVHDGIDNTLVILRNKLKAGIEVRRDYGADVPPIRAYGSELNQVWTNLLDNAADAMNGRG